VEGKDVSKEKKELLDKINTMEKMMKNYQKEI